MFAQPITNLVNLAYKNFHTPWFLIGNFTVHLVRGHIMMMKNNIMSVAEVTLKMKVVLLIFVLVNISSTRFRSQLFGWAGLSCILKNSWWVPNKGEFNKLKYNVFLPYLLHPVKKDNTNMRTRYKFRIV